MRRLLRNRGQLEKISFVSIHVRYISIIVGVVFFSCYGRPLWLETWGMVCRWGWGAALEARLRTVIAALVGDLGQGGG